MKSTNKKAYWWVPTLYFAEALPYVAVMTIAGIMFKKMGLSNEDATYYTAWFYLPWVIKPIWSPIVDALRTKRWWILTMQFIMGVAFASIAFTLPFGFWLQSCIALFWLMAFSSATHDIAADGFYILALDSHDQAFYVGIRSTFYRIATLVGQGLLVMLAGWVEKGMPLGTGDDATHLCEPGRIAFSWAVTFYVMAFLFLALWAYHRFALPKVEKQDELAAESPAAVQREAVTFRQVLHDTLKSFAATVKIFFSKQQIVAALLFMLLFRFPEALLVNIVKFFMLDPAEAGGLGLDTETVGLAYGTIGMIGLTLGGLLGGFLVAKDGLKRWLWPMVLSISVPDAVYIYLSFFPGSDIWLVDACVFLEQFGYGFGFTAYMLYLIYFARGEQSTSVYALCTAFMALGMMLPGMVAGKLADLMGYQMFFIVTFICCAITFLVSAFLKIDPQFGKKEDAKKE